MSELTDIDELRAEIARLQGEVAKHERQALVCRGILRLLITADARGQGQPFADAMARAVKQVGDPDIAA